MTDDFVEIEVELPVDPGWRVNTIFDQRRGMAGEGERIGFVGFDDDGEEWVVFVDQQAARTLQDAINIGTRIHVKVHPDNAMRRLPDSMPTE